MDTRVEHMDKTCDPVKLEIVKGSLRAAQLEMETLLERTAVSPVIREKKDFLLATSTSVGQLITGTNLPIFGHIIQPIFEHYPAQDMREGDLYWYNDCYASKGGVSHMPDQVFAAPVFSKGSSSDFPRPGPTLMTLVAPGLGRCRQHRPISFKKAS